MLQIFFVNFIIYRAKFQADILYKSYLKLLRLCLNKMYGYFYFTSKDYKTDVLSLCYLDVWISILLIKLLIFEIFLIFIEHLNIKAKIRIDFVHMQK